MVYIGIDPGSPLTVGVLNRDGTIHSIHEDEAVATAFEYLTKSGNKASRWENNPALIASILRDFDAARAVVEQVSIRPGEALGSGMKFVGSMWLTLGAAAALGLPCRRVVPQVWKRDMGIKVTLRNPKEPARLRALEVWPGRAELFRRKKDHNRAEALLLAEWLRRQEGEP